MKITKIDNKRIALYDNLRFLLILLVVIGHFIETKQLESNIYQSIGVCIYTFHMPLFLFISGLFHKNDNIIPKTLTYLCIGFLLKIVIFINTLFLYGNAKFSFLSDSSIPWYMFVLAIYIDVSYVLRNINQKFLLIFSIILGCFVGYDTNIGDFLYLSRAIVFYPFFMLGNMFDKEKLLKITQKKFCKTVVGVIILLWVLLCIFQLEYIIKLSPLFTGRNPFSTNRLFVKWGFMYRTLCYIITSLIGFCVVCIVPNKYFPMITLFGSRTLQVYFWHCTIIIVLIKYQVNTYLCVTSAGKIIWFLCAILCTFILSLKPFQFPVAQIIRSCKYSESFLNSEKKNI